MKEMAWSGIIRDSQKEVSNSYEDREFLDNDQDLEYAIVCLFVFEINMTFHITHSNTSQNMSMRCI